MGKSLRSFLIFIALLFFSGGILYSLFPGFLFKSGIRIIRWWGGLRRYEVQVDDHRWVYLEGGKGKTILFVHGFGADKDRWGTFITSFSKDYRVVAPDLPGFGESSRIASACYDIPTQVKRLDRFVKILGLSRFHLVGISMGGYIGAYYASQYPEKVETLALMDPAGVRSRIPSFLEELYRKTGNIPLLYRTPAQFDRMMAVVFHHPPWVPGAIRGYLAREGAANYTFYRKILRDMIKGGMDRLEGRLKNIRARTLLIWGADDRVLHVSGVEKFEMGLRDKRRVVIMEDCGHVPYIEKPGQTIMIYRDFLESAS